MRDHFRNLEEKLPRQDVRHSPNDAGALSAVDFFEFGRTGVVWSRQQGLGGLAEEPPMERSMRDLSARHLSGDVSQSVATASGEEWRSLRSSIWILTDGRWQMVFHQETPTQPNPWLFKLQDFLAPSSEADAINHSDATYRYRFGIGG